MKKKSLDYNFYRIKDYVYNLTSLAFISTAIGLLAIGVISLILKIFKIDFIGLMYWGLILFIPAFTIIYATARQYIINKRIKSDILKSIIDRKENQYNIEKIAIETGIKLGDLLYILSDLRSEGRISYEFNPENKSLQVYNIIA